MIISSAEYSCRWFPLLLCLGVLLLHPDKFKKIIILFAVFVVYIVAANHNELMVRTLRQFTEPVFICQYEQRQMAIWLTHSWSL